MTTRKLAALTETFIAALYSMCLRPLGDYYVDSYLNYATNELGRRADDLESGFMPFLESAADSGSSVFNEWVDSEVPLRIHCLTELWVKLGCPEPEYSVQGGIEQLIRQAVRDYIAGKIEAAVDRLGALLIEFKAQLDEALDADELDAGEPVEVDRYAGLYTRRVTVDGIVLSRWPYNR